MNNNPRNITISLISINYSSDKKNKIMRAMKMKVMMIVKVEMKLRMGIFVIIKIV